MLTKIVLAKIVLGVAGLIGLGLSFTAAEAQTRYHGPDGPYVLPTDLGTGRPNPDDPRAIPVPSVMNGGGFGLTGTGYYSDSPSERDPVGRRRVDEYVLVPALVGPRVGRP